MRIINAEQLVDYAPSGQTSIFGQRAVLYGVKVIYEQNDDQIIITFFPRGIKHSDSVQALGDRIQEAFGMSVVERDDELSFSRYVLRDIRNEKMEVSENDF